MQLLKRDLDLVSEIQSRIKEREEFAHKFKDKNLGNINSYSIHDENSREEFLKFKSNLYNELLNYADIDIYNKTWVFFTIQGKEYKMHPAGMYLNLIMFDALMKLGHRFTSEDIFDITNINKNIFKDYLDRIIEMYIKIIDRSEISHVLSEILYEFTSIPEDFGYYIGTTIDLVSDVRLMNKSEAFNKALHAHQYIDDSMQPQEIEAYLSAATSIAFDEISKDINHCLHPLICSKEGLNRTQYTKYAIGIGMSPDGKGKVIPKTIQTSFLEGIKSVSDYYIDSTGGRIAQNIQKSDVGESGAMARRLSLLAQGMRLHKDKHYDCGTRNYEQVYIKNSKVLKMFVGKYRVIKDHKLAVITKKNTFLVGQTIEVRSVITCACTNGEICYKCYGDLAFINNDIDVGNYGSRVFSERTTQTSLSAKHVLTSNSKNSKFSDNFSEFFTLEMSQVTFNITNPKLDKSRLVIRDEDIETTEDGNFKVNMIIIEDKKNKQVVLPEDDTVLLLAPYMSELYRSKDDSLEELDIPIKSIGNLASTTLFLTDIVNNDLTTTFKDSHRLLETKDGVGRKTYSQLLEAQIEILDSTGLHLPAVHIECIIRNMVRSNVDSIKLPDWRIPNNVAYEIYPVISAIKQLGVITSLSFQEFEDQIKRPSTYKKTGSSSMDYLFRPVFGNLTKDISYGC